MIDAGVVEGRTVTSWPSLERDRVNAGSRKPDDLPAFNAKMIEELVEGAHGEARAAGVRTSRSVAAPRTSTPR